MVDGEKTNKVRIVDDEREAAHIARTGETPIPFTGHMECPGCLDGRVTHNHDLRPPPKDPSHRRFRHLTHQHEHNHWSVRRLPKGRMTADDILGHQVPHPFEMIHHTEDGSSREGGFFNTQGHLAFKEGAPIPNINMGLAKQLIQYLDVDAPTAGSFNNAEFNKILGLGHPETGMASAQNVDTGEWTHKPVDFGNLRAGEDLHWQNLGMKKIWGTKQGMAEQKWAPDFDHPNPGIGPWLQWQSTLGQVALHDHAEERLEKFNNHDHLRSVGEGVRKNKTPCFYCVGTGTVQGHRVLEYLSAFPGWDSLESSTVGTGEWVTLGYGDDAQEVETTARSAKMNARHEESDQHHDEINQYLSTHSSHFGSPWRTADPLTELIEDPLTIYLCPECSGLGICVPCGGEGKIPVADPSMSEEEIDAHNAAYPRWKKMTNIAFSSPGQPWMRPGVSASGQPLPSFVQVRPGEGQWDLDPHYTDRPPYIELPFEPAPKPRSGWAAVSSPTPPPELSAEEQAEKARLARNAANRARADRRRVAVAHAREMREMQDRIDAIKEQRLTRAGDIGAPLSEEERAKEEEYRLRGRYGNPMTEEGFIEGELVNDIPIETGREKKDRMDRQRPLEERMMEVLSGRRPAPPPSQPPSSQVLVTGPQRATSDSIPEDEEVDGDDMYQALDETDHRNFKLVDNKTPFENHGMQAWDEWDGRKKIPNQFKSPKETKSYMGGKSFFIDERGVGHVDFKEASDDYTAKLREHRDKWDSRRATGYVGAPDAPTEEDERKQLDKDFLTEQRRAHEKVLQQLAHQIYIAPNAIWARRSYDHLRRALTHKPIKGKGRAAGSKLDNSHLLREFERRGGGEGEYQKDKEGKDVWKPVKGKIDNEQHVMDSGLAEMALFRMIRAIHPDWVPAKHDDLRMNHEDYVHLATHKQKKIDDALGALNLSEGALMRDALAILKFYDARTSTRERVGVVDTIASVSSLNLAASAHPNQVAVRR